MQFSIIGLGRMGTNLARQALEKKHEVVGFDVHPAAVRALESEGAAGVLSLQDLKQRLRAPRFVLIYVPHGKPTDETIRALAETLQAGDIVMDGGNSHWRDAERHNAQLRSKGIGFLDVGTSGGLEGARHGACFMAGGEPEHFKAVEPLLRSLAVPDGVVHAGPVGAGHFVKLIHNGIEFGMLQALGEGLDLLARSDYPLDLAAIFHNWAHGSVIRGWLVELMEQGLRQTPLTELSSFVEDTREVRWVVEYALEKEAWIPVIAQSELALYRYREAESVAGKGVALLRHGFGGHPLHRKAAGEGRKK
ncbi:MAG: phosphogluconate dehydrogenase (NAD(+)-dependent, decarboxylating) [Candidatus Acidiferrales bacterium]